MGLNPLEAPVDVTIACWEWGAYLGEEGKRSGVRAKVSSWRRISPDSLIPHAKASGQYLNSVLAKIESRQVRLRRGDPARRPRLRLRGHRREHLRRPRRRDHHARHSTTRSSTGITRRSMHPDRPRPRLHGRRAHDRPRRDVSRRRGVPVRHRRGARAGQRDRRPRDRRAARRGEITPRPAGAFDDAIHGRSERYREWLDRRSPRDPAPSRRADGTAAQRARPA